MNPNKQDRANGKPKEESETSRKRLRIILKIAGGGLLLFAFVMQIRHFDKAGQENERIQAGAIDARAHIKALEYENLYYAVKASGQDNPEYLRLAAYNYYMGKVGLLATSLEDKATITKDLNELKRRAQSVHDVASFQSFLGSVNDLNDKSGPADLAGLEQTDRQASRNGNLYFALFLVGSLIALCSEVVDWPRAKG